MGRATYSSAEADRRGKKQFEVKGWTGLNMSKDSALIADTDLADCLNVCYDTPGDVEKRKGTKKLLLTSVGGGITGLHPFYSSKNGLKQLLFANDTATAAEQRRYDNAGGSALHSTYAFTKGGKWSYATARGVTYAVNGRDGLFKYTGSGNYVLVSNQFKFEQIVFYKNRLFGFEPNTSWLRFSDADNAESFPIQNIQEINTEDGSNVTGIDSDEGRITVHKDGEYGSIWMITGEPIGAGDKTQLGNLQLDRANSEVGTCSWRTIATISQGVQVFGAVNGIYILQNGSTQPIHQDIEPLFRERMNLQYMHTCWGVYNRTEKKYLLGYPSKGSTYSDSVIMLDLANPTEAKYALWDNMPGSCAVNFRFTEGRDTTLIGHPTLGYIYEAFTGYHDLASANGFATSATATTLSDTTKAWTVDELKDANVRILVGRGRGQVFRVLSNTATQLTIDGTWPVTPDTTSEYTVGGYRSYGDTKVYNQEQGGFYKKYKHTDIFTTSESSYPLEVDVSYDHHPLGDYSAGVSLDDGSLKWGQIDPETGVRMKWGKAGYKWGGARKLHRRIDLGGEQARTIQYRFGNDRADQPWRLSTIVTVFAYKKNRPD